ncbi:MAG TPA: TerC/Alx family metal homeostasis membrane protein [Baekduia sp.]|nr:TerC/Alx family metal homeostasis membrane protein [Baekduia sp.]
MSTTLSSLAPWAALLAVLVALLALDLKVFARGREPTFREGAAWSIGWLVLSLLAAGVVWLLSGPQDAGLYTTVYLVERALSLDNLFVFLLLFSYFGVPAKQRAPLLFWGIVAALALRGAAILIGVALIAQFHFVLYLLGVALLVLAWRMFRGVEENVDPDRNLLVRGVRRLYPVTDRFHGRRWLVTVAGRRHATPLLLALAAIVFADLAFALDSIPAAFAITQDPIIIWMANIFALLGLRALFVLIDGLIRRLRYLDETIALVLGAVAVKLLIDDLVHIGPAGSLAIVAAIFAAGIGASLIAQRRDPQLTPPMPRPTPPAPGSRAPAPVTNRRQPGTARGAAPTLLPQPPTRADGTQALTGAHDSPRPRAVHRNTRPGCEAPRKAPADQSRDACNTTRARLTQHAAPVAAGCSRPPVRVMVVDDHHAVREGLRAMLQAEPGLDPVGTAATARDALALIRHAPPDVIVLDYHLPDEDGLSLCLRLKTAHAEPAALLYSAFADEQLVPLAIIAGADAVMSKAADPDALCDTIRALAEGARRLPAIAPAAMESAAVRLDSEDLPILGMLTHGTPPAEIATTLRMAEPWLATRRWAMLERLTGAAARRSAPRHPPP